MLNDAPVNGSNGVNTNANESWSTSISFSLLNLFANSLLIYWKSVAPLSTLTGTALLLASLDEL